VPSPDDDRRVEQRIVDLELRFMREEKLLAELNDVVVQQQRAIDRLTAEVKALREQLLAGTDAPKDERPPHY
jgi:SlyX protein